MDNGAPFRIVTGHESEAGITHASMVWMSTTAGRGGHNGGYDAEQGSDLVPGRALVLVSNMGAHGG